MWSCPLPSMLAVLPISLLSSREDRHHGIEVREEKGQSYAFSGLFPRRCRQIIIPVRRPRSWCAYAWDMKMQNTSILDPMAAMATEEATLETHRTTIRRLHAALANCIELFFDGWTPDWQKWEITVVKSDNLTATTEQSALYTLFNIINFNGRKLVVEPTTEATKAFRENFLYEMMSIEDNKGKVSSIFVHTIED